MALVLDLNPSIDRWYKVDDFKVYGSYKTRDFSVTPGGEGINVAKVIREFYDSVTVAGFIGGEGGRYIESELDRVGIGHRFIQVKGETRNVIRILGMDGRYTEIEEEGGSLSIDDVISFYELYKELILDHDIICACGHLGSRLPQDIYRDLIVLAKEYGRKVFLNTSGEALKLAVEALPFFIRLNKYELEEYIGCTIDSEREIIQAGKYLSDDGIEVVLISLGEEGAIAFYDGYIYRIRVPRVEVTNPSGAGDSMVGGFISAILRKYDFEFALRMAAACGTANVMEIEPGRFDMANMKRIMNDITITKSSF